MRREARTALFAGLLVLAATAPTGAQELRSGVAERKANATWKKVDDRKVTLPAGTMLAVRLIDRVSSDKNQTGDRFEATLDTPVMIDGAVAADKGASVVGRVVRARKAGRMTNPSELVLELVELVCPTGRVPIETDPIERSGESSSHAGDAVAIGSTAALGTALGAIFGGGRGAAIGAAAGGAVGAGGTLGAKGKATAVKSEAVLMFRLRTPATLIVFETKEKQNSDGIGR